LDVVLIGTMNLRGSVVAARVIGVFHLIDGGDVDDKLIAVVPGSPLGDVDSLAELDARFPGITASIETWFVNYKGPAALQSGGFGEADEAWRVLQAAMAAYQP
jgi:inorganic pyrophosphatase